MNKKEMKKMLHEMFKAQMEIANNEALDAEERDKAYKKAMELYDKLQQLDHKKIDWLKILGIGVEAAIGIGGIIVPIVTLNKKQAFQLDAMERICNFEREGVFTSTAAKINNANVLKQ